MVATKICYFPKNSERKVSESELQGKPIIFLSPKTCFQTKRILGTKNIDQNIQTPCNFPFGTTFIRRTSEKQKHMIEMFCVKLPSLFTGTRFRCSPSEFTPALDPAFTQQTFQRANVKTCTQSRTQKESEKRDRETDRQTDRQTETETETETDRQTDRQRQRERERDRQTDRQTEIHTRRM